MSLVRLGLFLLLAGQWGAALGASSEAEPNGNNPKLLEPATVDTSEAVAVEEADIPSTEEILHKGRLFVDVTPYADADVVPALEVRSSEVGEAEEQARQAVSEPSETETGGRETESSSAVPEVLVALIFAIFGLLLITRRKHSHEG